MRRRKRRRNKRRRKREDKAYREILGHVVRGAVVITTIPVVTSSLLAIGQRFKDLD